MFYFTKFEKTHNLLTLGIMFGRSGLAEALVSFQKAVIARWLGGLLGLPVCSILDLDEFLYFQPSGNSRLGFLEFFKRLLQDFLMPHLHDFPIYSKTSPLILMAPIGDYVPGNRMLRRMDYRRVRHLDVGQTALNHTRVL
jgi:hypothetical protein